MNKFCVNCGSEKDLVSELCVRCYKKENTILKQFKELKIKICAECGNYLHKNSWKEAFSDNLSGNISKIVEFLFGEKIIIEKEFKLDKIKFEVKIPKNLKVGNGNIVHVNILIDVSGTLQKIVVEETYEIPIKVEFNCCNNCKKLRGRYFEAKLQIRPMNDRIFRFVEKYCETRKNLFISKIDELKFGYDIYLNDQRETRNLGNILKKKFGGELIVTKKLFGRKDGRDIYRATVLIRI